jgi:hypothetical protein
MRISHKYQRMKLKTFESGMNNIETDLNNIKMDQEEKDNALLDYLKDNPRKTTKKR